MTQSEVVEHGIVAPNARAELARIAHTNFNIVASSGQMAPGSEAITPEMDSDVRTGMRAEDWVGK